jgi:hypothetical protein
MVCQYLHPDKTTFAICYLLILTKHITEETNYSNLLNFTPVSPTVL